MTERNLAGRTRTLGRAAADPGRHMMPDPHQLTVVTTPEPTADKPNQHGYVVRDVSAGTDLEVGRADSQEAARAAGEKAVAKLVKEFADDPVHGGFEPSRSVAGEPEAETAGGARSGRPRAGAQSSS